MQLTHTSSPDTPHSYNSVLLSKVYGFLFLAAVIILCAYRLHFNSDNHLNLVYQLLFFVVNTDFFKVEKSTIERKFKDFYVLLLCSNTTVSTCAV